MTRQLLDRAPTNEGRRRRALAHNLGRDALGDLGKGSPIDHEGPDRVAENVDEAGADDMTGCVHEFGCVAWVNGARRRQRGNAVAGQRYIAVKPRVTGPVYNAAACDETIVHRISWLQMIGLRMDECRTTLRARLR